jgi:uncharacterized DUF497 family protein
MRSDDFEWDDAKAAANYARHGITFAMASDVFISARVAEPYERRRYHEESR